MAVSVLKVALERLDVRQSLSGDAGAIGDRCFKRTLCWIESRALDLSRPDGAAFFSLDVFFCFLFVTS
jgi:hypothetical protein